MCVCVYFVIFYFYINAAPAGEASSASLCADGAAYRFDAGVRTLLAPRRDTIAAADAAIAAALYIEMYSRLTVLCVCVCVCVCVSARFFFFSFFLFGGWGGGGGLLFASRLASRIDPAAAAEIFVSFLWLHFIGPSHRSVRYQRRLCNGIN